MSSDLRILMLGADDMITAIGNSLLGRKVFDEEQNTCQRDSVALADGRTLHVTAALCRQVFYVSDGMFRLSDQLVTDINSTDYHAVILSMEIKTNLTLTYPTAADTMLKEEAWKNFLRKKGIIVVREANTFTKAQKSEEISGSFLDWMRTQTGVVGTIFQELQERCLLFDTTGSQDVLNKKRSELVDMIDVQVCTLFGQCLAGCKVSPKYDLHLLPPLIGSKSRTK
ncbi:hypothetical protein ElyMa_005257600 [Elysia marginata]|uniref:AIG1-type G domain-containing protein n=1 Tax=Elysia marginata TaxID=1093978 RepID=A0AAV4K388_9GAST|nr:hypothetical protein ElyMa_005257600 [Elysia marginata]